MEKGPIPLDFIMLQIGDILDYVKKEAPEDVHFWESILYYLTPFDQKE